MKLQSLFAREKIKGAFLKKGNIKQENFDKNNDISIFDVLLDPNNLDPVRIGGCIFQQCGVIPAKEALFFVGCLIENGQPIDGLNSFACRYDEHNEPQIYMVKTDSDYGRCIKDIYYGLANGTIKNKPKPLYSNKGKKVAFGFMTFFYVLILVAGIIGCMVFPEYKKYAIILSCLTPMWLTYFFFHNPFDKELSRFLFVLSILLSVACCVGHVLFFKDALSIILLVLFYVFQILAYAKFCQDKSSFMYVLIGIGSIILVPITVVVFIIGILLVIGKFLGSLFGATEFGAAFKRGYNGESEPETTYELTDEMGMRRKLKRVGGDYYHSDRYVDDTGSYWYSEDNGVTFSRE